MQVYNTMARAKQPFVPATDGKVGIYVCGATVQSAPHLGHGRYAVVFDVIRRYLEWSGYDVTYVSNVTDIEDKIIAEAERRGIAAEEVAAEAAEQFLAAFRALGVRDPDHMPRATEHVSGMIELVQKLVAAGHAYEADGDVYFAVRSFPGYGKLSGRSLDDLLAGARVAPDERKRDPADFALWKAAKPGEPHWESPWGPGRPGWHIECSVMAARYLGFGFDIHGGGADLIFPHHENEIAQSEAAAGSEPFARFWLHNGLLTLSGEKMAKSTGKLVGLLDVLADFPALAVRLFYLRKRYREPFDYSEEAVADAAAQLERLWAFRRRAGEAGGSPDAATLDAFREAMDDDFNTAAALAALFDGVREGNRRLDTGEDAGALIAAYDEIVGVLGIAEPAADLADLAGPVAEVAERFGVGDGATAAESVAALVAAREAARRERDFATADGIRDALAAAGVRLEDGADGTRWHRA